MLFRSVDEREIALSRATVVERVEQVTNADQSAHDFMAATGGHGGGVAEEARNRRGPGGRIEGGWRHEASRIRADDLAGAVAARHGEGNGIHAVGAASPPERLANPIFDRARQAAGFRVACVERPCCFLDAHTGTNELFDAPSGRPVPQCLKHTAMIGARSRELGGRSVPIPRPVRAYWFARVRPP